LLNATDTDEPVGKTDMFFALRERQRHPEDPQWHTFGEPGQSATWHTFGELCQDSDIGTVGSARDAPHPELRGRSALQASVFEEFGNLKGRLTYPGCAQGAISQ
jgi:hypothetical protein